MHELLSVKNLSLSFLGEDNPDGSVKVLDNVNLEIEPASTHALVGESGSGKSVTALSILRLLEDVSRVQTKGKILFNNQDMLTLPKDELLSVRGNKISMIFQKIHQKSKTPRLCWRIGKKEILWKIEKLLQLIMRKVNLKKK